MTRGYEPGLSRGGGHSQTCAKAVHGARGHTTEAGSCQFDRAEGGEKEKGLRWGKSTFAVIPDLAGLGTAGYAPSDSCLPQCTLQCLCPPCTCVRSSSVKCLLGGAPTAAALPPAPFAVEAPAAAVHGHGWGKGGIRLLSVNSERVLPAALQDVRRLAISAAAM